MATTVKENTVWAAGVAAKLRLLLVNCADAPASRRHEFLCEAISEALKSIPSAQQGACLDALAERFPAWNAAPPPAASTPAAAPETPGDLVQRLATLAPTLPAETKAVFTQVLRGAGLIPPEPKPAAGSGEVAAELQKQFGLEQPPTAERIVSLMALLAGSLEKLDEVACRAFKNLPARADFEPLRSGDGREVHEAIRSFLAANGESQASQPVEASQRVIEKHRRAIAALLASPVGLRNIPSAGKEFSRWFHELFKPEFMEEVVGPGLFGRGERCWKKYKERFYEELATPEHVDKRLRDAVAGTAERIFQLKA
jgi:hypothetical protein